MGHKVDRVYPAVNSQLVPVTKVVQSFMEHKTITCPDCGADFLFTKGEQEYYALKRLSDPKRCKGCRAARREQKPATASVGR